MTLFILEISNYPGFCQQPGCLLLWGPVTRAPPHGPLREGRTMVGGAGRNLKLVQRKLNTAIWKRRESTMQIVKEPLLYHLCAAQERDRET